MQDFIEFMRELNVYTVIIRIVLATVMGGVIGIERFKQGRAAGMRTHILVALGAALASMMGIYLNTVLGYTNDPARIAAQVVSGIGFLGMGTILVKGRFQITGLTTAAGLWATAAIGLALGMGFYSGAIITFICAVLTVTLMSKLEYILTKRYNRFGIYVEIKSDEFVRQAIDMLKEN
jgi:putative Mg2+ transporter-C (MgtC) family protein